MIKFTLLFPQKNNNNNFSVKFLLNQESVKIFNQNPHLFLIKLLSYSKRSWNILMMNLFRIYISQIIKIMLKL